MVAASVKVLLAGDCNGAFKALFTKVAAVNKKNGPFDALFCVGNFFAPGDPDGPVPQELMPYIDGDTQLPMATYFLGASGMGSHTSLNSLKESAAQLHYLGRSGVTEVKGLKVAYLDGSYSPEVISTDPSAQGPGCSAFTEVDVVLLKQQLRSLAGDVDLLLTCEWPQGVLEGVQQQQRETLGVAPKAGSQEVTDVAVLARPRYHVVGSKGVFFQRMPYVNPDQGAGPRVTRFISLGMITPKAAGVGDKGSKGKQTFLHALGLPPASELSVEKLSAVPPGSDPSPYEAAKKKGNKRPAEEEEGEGGFNRWQQPKRAKAPSTPFTPWGNPAVPKDLTCCAFVRNLPYAATYQDVAAFFSAAGAVLDIRRQAQDDGRPMGWAHVQFDEAGAVAAACALNGSMFMGRTLYIDAAESGRKKAAGPPAGEAVSSCWFCLSSPHVDTNLVASIGDEVYLALDKGQINPNHVLLVPIEHYPSMVAAPLPAYQELQQYVSGLRACFASQGAAFVGFERHLALRQKGGNHCHLNAVSVDRAAGERAAEVFRRMATEAGFELSPVPAAGGQLDRAALADIVGQGEYFLALLPDGSGLVHAVQPGSRWPMQLGRQMLAELAGDPSKADWRSCTAEPEAEAAECERFKASFKKFDPMAQQ